MLDAVLSTDLGAQRCFKFPKKTAYIPKQNENNLTDGKPFVACGFCGVKISPMIAYNTNIPHIF